MCIFGSNNKDKDNKKKKKKENKCLSCDREFDDGEVDEYEGGEPCCAYCRSNRTTPNRQIKLSNQLLLTYRTRKNMENTNTKYCQSCGAENSLDAAYCSKCGSSFNASANVPQNKRISGFATAGFIMSILAWLLDYSTELYDVDFFLGIIFCFIGLHYTKQGQQKGRGLAVFGIISYVAVFIVMILSAMAGTL